MIWRNGQVGIKDEGSVNGTYVNGEDVGFIGQGFQAVRSGDTLTIGGSTFIVFLIDAAEARRVWPNSPWATTAVKETP
jgi:pSer/pThr/pTyr-binding forkhead associated (FHA) protein